MICKSSPLYSYITFQYFTCMFVFQGLPIINRFVASQDNCECLCEQPLYEEESETETVVSHARRPVSYAIVVM
jgi:hypothetical protein